MSSERRRMLSATWLMPDAACSLPRSACCKPMSAARSARWLTLSPACWPASASGFGSAYVEPVATIGSSRVDVSLRFIEGCPHCEFGLEDRLECTGRAISLSREATEGPPYRRPNPCRRSAHELLEAPRDPADETGALVTPIAIGNLHARSTKEIALGLETLPIQDLPLLVRDHQARKALVDRGQRLADRVAVTAGAQLAQDVLDLLGLF